MEKTFDGRGCGMSRVDLMLHWDPESPDTIKLVDLFVNEGYHIPVSTGDLTWILDAVHRLRVAADRARVDKFEDREAALMAARERLNERVQDAAREREDLLEQWRELFEQVRDPPVHESPSSPELADKDDIEPW
jgi:hypothetical protein